MKILEIRRHAKRILPNEHLSREGILMARRLGGSLGSFDHVIASRCARAAETAVAMGFAVDEEYWPVNLTEEEWRALDRLMPESSPFVRRAQVMKMNGLASRYALGLREQWCALSEHLDEGERALVISHGGYMEDSAVACLPDAPHQDWGPNFAHLEGFRLFLQGGRFVGGELLRLPWDAAIVNNRAPG